MYECVYVYLWQMWCVCVCIWLYIGVAHDCINMYIMVCVCVCVHVCYVVCVVGYLLYFLKWDSVLWGHKSGLPSFLLQLTADSHFRSTSTPAGCCSERTKIWTVQAYQKYALTFEKISWNGHEPILGLLKLMSTWSIDMIWSQKWLWQEYRQPETSVMSHTVCVPVWYVSVVCVCAVYMHILCIHILWC